MKKWYFTCVSVLLVLGLAGNSFAAEKKHKLAFGTGATGLSYYMIGTGLATVINKYVPNAYVIVQASPGTSDENFRLLSTGRIQLGLCSADNAIKLMDAGVDASGIRVLTGGHGGVAYWTVRANSDIYTVEDFKGKKIGIGGSRGAPAPSLWLPAFKIGWGIDEKDMRVKYLPYKEAQIALKDGVVDIAIGTGTEEGSAAYVLDTATMIPLRIIDLAGAGRKKFFNSGQHPGDLALGWTLKAGYLPGFDKEVKTIGFPPTTLYCSKEVPEDLVYNILKAIWEHTDVAIAAHKGAKQYKPQNAFRKTKAVGIPFHPGSIRALKEKGLWTSKTDIQ